MQNLNLHTVRAFFIELVTRRSELLRYNITQIHQVIKALLQSLEGSSRV